MKKKCVHTHSNEYDISQFLASAPGRDTGIKGVQYMMESGQSQTSINTPFFTLVRVFFVVYF